MPFYGDLSEFSLADFLYLINMRRTSGRLTLQAEHDDVELWFQQGRLVHVSSNQLAHHLGQWLIRRGRLTRDQLGAALTVQATTPVRHPLGSLLIQFGWLTESELSLALTEQAEAILFSVLEWSHATFNFVAVAALPPHIPLRELNMEKIILEAARRADEWFTIRQRIPSLDCAVTLPNRHLRIELESLSPATRLVMASLLQSWATTQDKAESASLGNGFKVTTLRELGESTGLSGHDLMRAVYELVESQLLVIAAPVAAGAH